MQFADPAANGGQINIYNTSAMPPPLGEHSNFIDAPVPLRTVFNVVAIVCITLISIFVPLRIYTKLAILREFLLEDVSLVLAWLGVIAWYVLNFTSPEHGKHMWNVTMAEEIHYAQTLNLLLILFAPLSFLPKYTILTQMKRIFTKDRNMIWWLIQISIWINVVLYLALMFISIFQCWPRAKIGNPFMPGTCLPFAILVVPPTGIILLSDVWMLVLPILIVWRLNIALQRKYAIIAAFGMGIVSTGAVAMELYFCVVLSTTHDLSYSAYPVALSAGVQMSSLILAAAVPTMPVLWLALRNIVMQESEPSKMGTFPPKPEPQQCELRQLQHQGNKDLERCESACSYDRPETPYEILTTTEVRVTSMHLERNDLR